jgi:type VI secretion system protein ImpB
MPESIQHKLDRVRRPRVQITYDVETLGSIVKTELPFVVGIMADLSGNAIPKLLNPANAPKTNGTPLKKRKFMEIDRDNFDKIMEKIAPTVQIGADTLTFKTLEDFSPIKVLNMTSLKAKFDSRTRLSNLLAKLDGNLALQRDLMNAIKNITANDRNDLQNYIKILHKQTGNTAAVKFDATALVQNLTPAQQRTLKAYIAEKYPHTVTPDTATLAAAVSEQEDKDALKTQILEHYPYAAPDAATLAAAITDTAKRTELQAYIQTRYPATASPAGATTPPDMATLIGSLNDVQKGELQAHITQKYPETVTGDIPTLVSRLMDEDLDDLKGYILGNFATQTKTVGEGLGAKFDMVILLNSLKAPEKKEVSAYIAEKFPPPVNTTEGGEAK